MRAHRILTAAALLGLASAAHGAEISHWTFDTDFTDSIGGRNLTAVGNAAITTSGARVGSGALILDGTDDRATFDVTGGDSLSGTYTIALFAAPTNANNSGTFFGSRASEFGFDAKFNAKIHGDIGNGSGWLSTGADSTNNFPTASGDWHHVAYVVTPSGYTIYADGDNVGSGTFSGTPVLFDANHDIAIGAVGINGGEFFAGKIDDVRIFNTALSQSEVQALVPEPASCGIALLGLGAVASRRRRR